MGLFKKPNRKFRQREARNESDDEDATNETEYKDKTLDKDKEKPSTSTDISCAGSSSTSSASAFSKEKDEKEPAFVKPSKLLSFHDEEDEGEVFKLKKSNYSRRLAKQREREKKKREETLLKPELKNDNQKEEKEVPIKAAESKTEPKAKDSWEILAGNEAEDMEVDSDDEKEKANPFKDVLQSGVIPDAATIYAMKKHRQMAREMGDFLPLEESEKDEGKSRLTRDDDNDDDDDDDDEPSRMNFTVMTPAMEKQKIRETFLSIQEGSTNELETEEALELDRWEQEQIRKGVGVAPVGTSQNTQISTDSIYTHPTGTAIYTESINHSDRFPPVQSMPVFKDLIAKDCNITTADIKARLQERLSTLKTIHDAHEQELADCEKQLVELSESVTKMKELAPKLEQNFSLYQQMSGYVKDLVECLDLKVAHIELLESRMLNLNKLRAQNIISRRQQDIRDQADEFSNLSSDIMKGVSVEFLNEKPSTTDEAKLRRAAEREGRRMRRRKKRERTMIIVRHQDGMSTDDEEPDSDRLKYRTERDSILEESRTIFEDVVEEFGTLDGVILSFELWKFNQLESYSEAFVPLCLPKIFGTFVRLSLLPWNPLTEDFDFEATAWFRQISCYGISKNCDKEQDDPDLHLLPAIMEKIVLPKITDYIQNVWDPLSRKETTKVIQLIKSLYQTYPTVNGKSKQLQICLKAVSTRILKSLDDDIFIPLYPKELLENRSLGAADFFQRQFWSSVKLMQNILMWEDLIAEEPLQHLSLASLLNRYLLMGLHTSMMMKDTLDKCKIIVGSFPKTWFQKARKGTTTLPLLKQFSSFLVKFSDNYHMQCSKRGMSEEEIKGDLKEVLQLLVSIESLEDAVSISKKYSVNIHKNS